MKKIKVIHLLYIAVFLGVTAALSYIFGFYSSQFKIFPHYRVEKITNTINLFIDKPQSASSQTTIESIFVDISVNSYPLEVEPDEIRQGGGITSFGESVLLMSFNGELYDITNGKNRRLDLELPSNGYSEYLKVTNGSDFGHLNHRPDRLRYNDILYYSDGADNGLVISYTEWIDDKACYSTTISHLPLNVGEESVELIEMTKNSWNTIFRSSPCLKLKDKFRALEGHMAGGRISYLGDKTVVLANGEYHMDGVYGPGPLSQIDDNDYGKVIQINLINGEFKHISKGHRNTQGIIATKSSIFVTEHGARGGDELNLIKLGKDYGWPSQTLGTGYDKSPWPGSKPIGRHDKFEAPLFAWLPSIAISNITQTFGFHPSWDGDLLVASMKAKSLYRIRHNGKRVVFIEEIEVGERLRYAHSHVNGDIYIWTDSYNVLQLKPKKVSQNNNLIQKIAEQNELTEPQINELNAQVLYCAECHSFNIGQNKGAPNLGNVYGRPIASAGYPNYSPALTDLDGVWDEKRLYRFLTDQQSVVTGSYMPNQDIEDPEVAQALIEYLQQLSTNLEEAYKK